MRLQSDLDVSKSGVTRKQLLIGAAPLAAAIPLGRYAVESASGAERMATHEHGDAAMGHAAMIGDAAPAPGGPNDLDALLIPPPALPYSPGRVREYTLTAEDRDVEVAQGVTFPAWTYNGTVPGPVIRATEDDMLMVNFFNGGSHPHTIHFHGIHPSDMDGVFEVVEPGGSFTYQFPARPYGMHLYHCHATPLKKHIHKGLYGAFIIDPPKPRRPSAVRTTSTRSSTRPRLNRTVPAVLASTRSRPPTTTSRSPPASPSRPGRTTAPFPVR